MKYLSKSSAVGMILTLIGGIASIAWANAYLANAERAGEPEPKNAETNATLKVAPAASTNQAAGLSLTNHSGSLSNEFLFRKVRLQPTKYNSNITKVVASLLMQSHYLRQPLNNELSGKFLEEYFNSWDPQHVIMLQSDIKEFEGFRDKLDNLTLESGDTSPAYDIFNRFLERFDQQVAFVHAFLATNQFTFDTDEKYLLNRRELPRPASAEEARLLWAGRLRFEYLQEKLNKEKPAEIVKIIARRYARLQRFLKEYDSEDVLQVYLTALSRVYDPHSDYMGRATMENFAIGMKLSLFGIGAVLRSEDGYCKIQELSVGGPAFKSGQLKPNDKIIGVAQGDGEPVEVVDMKLNKVVELIRGAKGTVVRLVVMPADAADPSTRKVVTIIRDEIKLESQEAKARIIDLPGGRKFRLGVIDLPSFYAEMGAPGKSNRKSTTADVSRLLKKLNQENVEGLILDLRHNGGGSLEEAIALTGLFIKSGPVVQVKDFRGRTMVLEDPEPNVYYEGPMIVLTSRHSASASEILAGALQDYGRALIVGDKSTHGKGTVQQLQQLDPILQQFGWPFTNRAGALKFTIQKFYLPAGASTQLRGVTPDIILPAITDYAEIGESSLPNALPWDRIDKAPFEHVNRVAPYLEALKKASEERRATDPDFVYLRSEMARARDIYQEKSITLNEQKRLQEKKDSETRLEARKKDLKARPESGQKVYEITLKQAVLPGLPPPLASTNLLASTGSHFGATMLADPGDSPATTKPEDAVPVVDIPLNEAEKILTDWIELLKKERN